MSRHHVSFFLNLDEKEKSRKVSESFGMSEGVFAKMLYLQAIKRFENGTEGNEQVKGSDVEKQAQALARKDGIDLSKAGDGAKEEYFEKARKGRVTNYEPSN